VRLIKILAVAVSLISSANHLAAQEGEAPGAGDGGSCWKCKMVSVPDGENTFWYQACDGGWSTGHAGCNSGSAPEGSFCAPNGAPCGAGNFEYDLAVGAIAKNGLMVTAKRFSLSSIERRLPADSGAAADGNGYISLVRDCRGGIVSARVRPLTELAVSVSLQLT
jgi:hypothetical protein